MTRRRPPLRRGRGFFAPVIVLVAVATLFTVSWQSHRASELRGEYSRLLRQRQYEMDRLLQLRTSWQRATSRREIVPRAIEELRMVERVLEPKEIIALRSSSADADADPGLGERLRAGFDRYGRIGSAMASESHEDGRP